MSERVGRCRLCKLEEVLRDAQKEYLHYEPPVFKTVVPLVEKASSELEKFIHLGEYTLASARNRTPLPRELQQASFAGVPGLAKQLKEAKEAYFQTVANQTNMTARESSKRKAVLRAACSPRKIPASFDSKPGIVKHLERGGLVDQLVGAISMCFLVCCLNNNSALSILIQHTSCQ